ncbi:MAG: hypothetical protein CL477_04030 [Acidobacteria bacterium]|nr:hypothetical protein [Acidobacteriota bacterium]
MGASRGRIVGQLFIEVLVLAAGATGVALVLVREGIARVQRFLGPELRDGAPFWWDFTLSFRTILFAAGLAVVAATIAGAVPALKATGRRINRASVGWAVARACSLARRGPCLSWPRSPSPWPPYPWQWKWPMERSGPASWDPASRPRST